MNNLTKNFFSRNLTASRLPRGWLEMGGTLGVVFCTLVCASRCDAAAAYGIDGNGNLRLITSLSTMTSVVLGPTPFFNGGVNVGLAIDPAGQLYAGDKNGDLFSLTPTGIPTLIGNPGLGPITGLDWDPVQNNLLVLTAAPFYKIFHANPTTGAQIGLVTTVSVPSNTQVEDIAWLNPSRAYITYRDPGNTVTAVQLMTLGAGGGVLIGTPAVSSVADNWTGVDVDPATGNTYMLGWFDDSWQVTNSAGNLTATHLATGNHLDWTAFAIAFPEVPEPGTGLLFGMGCAGVLFWRKSPAK